jgi:hypothetical protein
MADVVKSRKKVLGRVVKVKETSSGGYGFLLTDDHRKLFFHRKDVIDGVMPDLDWRVQCDVIRQSAKNKLDVAVNVEIVSAPA